ncbi:hypothetical protein PORY_000156 [Pneumocystis oryctolagi]|uniref:Uncharacterized protein n=1 Tax=Pneumocystis oryctolagi TaxID=42067 RepID=A0ACB7CGF6_9ASCO|nr:hypothetical protein PORY_000156 [Pneumocystis oryctolagi]
MIRRACYKCGDLGHFADSCTKTDRLCYNCKQPGHESNACPFPPWDIFKRTVRHFVLTQPVQADGVIAVE